MKVLDELEALPDHELTMYPDCPQPMMRIKAGVLPALLRVARAAKAVMTKGSPMGNGQLVMYQTMVELKESLADLAKLSEPEGPQ